MRWTISGVRDRGAEGPAAAPARRDDRTSAASCAARCASTAPSGSPTWRPRDRDRSTEEAHAVVAEVLDAAPMADLLAGYCLDVQPRPEDRRALERRWRRRCCSSCSARSSSARRGCASTSSCPGQSRGFYAHARDLHLDDFDDLAMAEAKGLDAVLGIQAPVRPARARRRRSRRGWRASPARGARCASAR